MGRLLKTRLYTFQRRAVKFALKNGSVALFMEQGCGKTLTILAIVTGYLQNNKGFIKPIADLENGIKRL